MWFFFLYYRQLPASKYRYSKWHELEDMDIKGNMLRSPRVRRSRWLKLIKACLHWFPNFPGETKFVDNAHSVYMLRIHEFLLWIPDNLRIIECHGVPTLPPPPLPPLISSMSQLLQELGKFSGYGVTNKSHPPWCLHIVSNKQIFKSGVYKQSFV